MRRPRYRVTQFVRGFSATVTPHELALAAQILPEAALARFHLLPVDAQRHSLNVLRDIHAAGVHDRDLDAAALLHDIGKLAAAEGSVGLSLWLRSFLVLTQSWSPAVLHRIAAADPAGRIRYAAYVHLEHARIGAEWAELDGCSELTCWLIRRHQDDINCVVAKESELSLLRALQAADGAN